MRNHPDWIRQSGFGAHIPLPKEWHLKRAVVIGGALIAVMVGFMADYHPQQSSTTDIPDTSTYDSGLRSISESVSSSVTEGGQ